ncbi:gamete expressed 2 [Wolffia australiana]
MTASYLRFFFIFHLPWILLDSSWTLSLANEDDLPLPGFWVTWLDNNSAFQAGDVATLMINGSEYAHKSKSPANFSLSVKGIKGNSSYVSNILSFTDVDPSYWRVTFVPIFAGNFSAVIIEEQSGVVASPLPYSVTPGIIYPPACFASWMSPENELTAGEKARVLILAKDAFGNNVFNVTEEKGSSLFKISSFLNDGSASVLQNITFRGWDALGHLEIEFVPVTAGSSLLQILSGNQHLSVSPLPFEVKPGPIDIKMCQGKWKYETNAIKIFSMLEFLIYQQDRFGNLVADSYKFDAGIVQKETNLSVPVADMSFQGAGEGIQLLSFIVGEPGNFMLRVFDVEKNWSISNTSYEYSVFVGYCDGENSIVNGSGLFSSVVGRMSYFSIYLEDTFRIPSPVEAKILTANIIRKNDTTIIRPRILPQKDTHGALSSPVDPGSAVQSSSFSVIYVPEKSGSYDVRIFCGNIPLNAGRPFAMLAVPGTVDRSKSRVVNFAARTRALVQNEVSVLLLDSLANPSVSQEGKLGFSLVNGSSIERFPFGDAGNGSYVAHYVARDIGVYNICVLYENSPLQPCPLEVSVFNDDYFPDAKNDTLSVWEDESVTFDAAANDYFSGSQVLIKFLQPLHGSLIQQGLLFRYTPYKGFFGVDSFSYSLTDAAGNMASGFVSISVLCKPPQFTSLPSSLQVTEDVIGPEFGGFPGFSIKYSDKTDNISVTIQAKSGHVFLSPMPYWAAMWSQLTVGSQSGRGLSLMGNVDAINAALESIQYLGDEDFYGNDDISLSASSRNGVRDAHVAINVDPVNDQPFIRVPNFVTLEGNSAEGGIPIFSGRPRSQADHFIGDPDVQSFPENRSRFLFVFSVEVSEGLLICNLPAHVIGAIELKIKDSHQWQHLQTFVTISNHFTIKAKGFRFRASIEDCNNALDKLLYTGSAPGSVLTIVINDMGNYGRCAECEEGKSTPLQAEATVNLIRRRPVSAIYPHCNHTNS